MRFIMRKFRTIRILLVYVIKRAHVNHLSILTVTESEIYPWMKHLGPENNCIFRRANKKSPSWGDDGIFFSKKNQLNQSNQREFSSMPNLNSAPSNWCCAFNVVCLKTGPFHNARQLQHISNKLMNFRTLSSFIHPKFLEGNTPFYRRYFELGTNFATLSCTVAISENVSCHLSDYVRITCSQRWPLRNQWIIKRKKILILVWLQPIED